MTPYSAAERMIRSPRRLCVIASVAIIAGLSSILLCYWRANYEAQGIPPSVKSSRPSPDTFGHKNTAIGSSDSAMAPLTHVVIFQYKSDVTDAQKETITEEFLALRNLCLSPHDPHFASPGAPYILDIIGGSNNSPEDAGKGYEHAYIVTFTSTQHRDYYVDHDPAHNIFKSIVGPLLEKVVVVDFIDGIWK